MVNGAKYILATSARFEWLNISQLCPRKGYGKVIEKILSAEDLGVLCIVLFGGPWGTVP